MMNDAMQPRNRLLLGRLLPLLLLLAGCVGTLEIGLEGTRAPDTAAATVSPLRTQVAALSTQAALSTSAAERSAADSSPPATQIAATAVQPEVAPASTAQETPSLWAAGTVAAGLNHTCAVTRLHTVKCWGNNSVGQLGDGSTIDSATPVDVKSLAGDIAGISAGSNHTCVSMDIVNLGISVRCWGSGEAGQLGVGELDNAHLPIEMSALGADGDQVASAEAGYSHTCAVMISGKVKCWGENSAGQLGDGTNISSSLPVDVIGVQDGGLPVVTGGAHTCVLVNDGQVQCWGYNRSGQLGDGTFDASNTPVTVKGLDRAVYLAAGQDHTCALLSDGRVQCWGSNLYGQLGDGTTTNRNVPVNVVGLRGVDVIASGATGRHTCALLRGGQVKCWGWNSHGQLGDGTTTDRPLPVDVSGLNAHATVISANHYHSCAVLIYGGIKCWGGNAAGQLGDGTYQQRLLPMDVIGAGGFPLTATAVP